MDRINRTTPTPVNRQYRVPWVLFVAVALALVVWGWLMLKFLG